MNKNARTILGWMCRVSAFVLWLGVVLSFVGWVVGRVYTDEYLWTQYLYWVPSLLRVACATVSLVCAWILQWCGRWLMQPEVRQGKPLRRWARWGGLRLAAVLIAVMLLHATLVEWKMLTSGVMVRADANGIPAWRLSYWNVSGSERGPWVSNVLAAEPDMVVIANAWGYKSYLEFRDAFKGGKGPTNAVFFDSRFMVATRWPLVRWGATELRIPASEEAKLPGGEDRYFRRDPGRAAFVELDVSEHPAMKSLGRPLVVWVVDLPSDISLPRMKVTRNAADAIASLGAETMAYTKGQWAPSGNRVPFPEPDVIVGDFNIPRGSASLRQLVANAVDAYDVAGGGYSATFPAGHEVALAAISGDPKQASAFKRVLARVLGRPWWKLDHAFVNADCRVSGYRVLDPGSGTHRLQMLDLRAKGSVSP